MTATIYVDSTAFHATLALTGETFADADITAALSAASRAIDELCGRRFYTTATDETRYFSPTRDSERYLGVSGFSPVSRVKVGDVVSVTSLATDPTGDGTFTDVWTATTDYSLTPINNALDSKPYRYVQRNPRGSFLFPSGPDSIKIVGKFGWAATPPQVVDLCTILASRLLKRKREAPFGIVSLGVDTAARIARTDPDIALLVQPFMEAPFA